jgi:Leucine-rich repeat (LRR) protein
MKGIIKTRYVYVMALVVLLGLSSLAKAAPVNFPDANLKAAVESKLGITDPTPTDMLLLTILIAENSGINDITGLEFATNLKTLWMRGNQISDLSPLSGLINITDLLMSNNQISDISHLSGMTGMTRLLMSVNQISDISVVAGMPNLGQLDLTNNQISDISPVANLTNLSRLYLRINQISDISPVANLTNLTNLSFSNLVSDISPLSNLTNLTWLSMSEGIVSDISPVANLTNLKTFWSWSSQISDLSPLSGLTTLTDVHVLGNQISDLSPLLLITNLTRLILSNNQVSDISPLSGMINLTQLHLHSNQISDISAISGMTNLGFLNLQNNLVSDISALSGLMNLGVLWMTTNPLSNESYCTFLPLIEANNPGINMTYDPGECTNQPPVAVAGGNLIIGSTEQSITTLQGTATDPDGDPLTYRWLEGTTELLASTSVVAGPPSAPLDLSFVSPLSIGAHTLTLEVDDGTVTATDDMILTIENSPPVVAPSGGGTFQLGDNITLSGNVADFDGDDLNYRWFEGTSPDFTASFIGTTAGGAEVALPDFVITGGLLLGNHTITLEADDGTNSPVSADITVDVIDTTAPTISATVSSGILWPPNHKMVDVVVQATANDNSGSVALTASVVSSEPPDSDGDGNTIPDYTTPVIDQSTGEITLQLRSERKGQGTGRTYTITVTATDSSGNSSDAIVTVVAPHDKGKK